jgi:hypothetical protein
MVEYFFISSVMNGIGRSLCNTKFEMYSVVPVLSYEACIYVNINADDTPISS